MIYGIGTDIVEIARIRAAIERQGIRLADRILAEHEREGYSNSPDPARFLAKRFAAKEAFGKALGTGVAVPATLHAVSVDHEPAGRPIYRFGPALAEHMAVHSFSAHLSLSDEADYVVAFALIEKS